MPNGSANPTHRVVIYRHEYGFRVSPGVLRLVQGPDVLVRFVNFSPIKLKLTLPGQPGSFDLAPACHDYKDVLVNASTPGDFPYKVEVGDVGIEAEGGSGPRIIITP
jgi:hypothetical protein